MPAVSASVLISIHAPRERSDLAALNTSITGWEFQSTLLVRGATMGDVYATYPADISIHAPRERSDCIRLDRLTDAENFNPRSS